MNDQRDAEDRGRRSAPIASPTEERTADQSTPGASGLETGRGEAPRDDADSEDPVMPAEDSALNTKI